MVYYYNARWYDPALGRFTQPDTLTPTQQGVQAWDRYAYTYNNPISYTDPSGHWTIKGWNDDYIQKQDGNTCAVVSIAVVLSIVNGRKYTQSDVQPTFPSTYRGIGVRPRAQAAGLNELLSGSGKVAIHYHSSEEDILNYLKNDSPVIVSIALPWTKGVGHAIVAVGYDPDINEINFFDPAYGDVQPENEILKRWGANGDYKTFDDLLKASNGLIGNNDLVILTEAIYTQTNPGYPQENDYNANDYVEAI